MYDSKNDIWALGVMIYEMMSFKKPFNANSLPALSLRILRGVYQPPPSYYSKDLINLVKMCLNLEPKKRPSAEMILKMDFMKKRICGYLDEINFNENLSMTVIKKYKEKRDYEKKKRKNVINKKKNDKGKIKKFFNKKNSADNNNNLDKNKINEKQEQKNEKTS